MNNHDELYDKKRPRRASGKRPPAPIKPKAKPGRPFVEARGEGPSVHELNAYFAFRTHLPERAK